MTVNLPLSHLDLPSGSIAYRELGEGPPLLLLHGWGVDSAVMATIMQRLATYRRCIAIDFPGFGGSAPPSSAWGVNDYADLVRNVKLKMNLGRCDILAHSFGGRVTLALLAADKKGEEFGKVLITGGAGMKPRRTWRYYYRKTLAKTLKAPFQLLPGKLKESGLNRLRQTAIWKSLGSSDYRNLDGVMREVFVKTDNHYQEDLLPQINHEILLLWGVNDDATPLYQGERLAKGLKNSALVKMDEAGHYAFLDQPSTFGAIAEAFFIG